MIDARSAPGDDFARLLAELDFVFDDFPGSERTLDPASSIGSFPFRPPKASDGPLPSPGVRSPWVALSLSKAEQEAIAARWDEEWTGGFPPDWHEAPAIWLIAGWCGLSPRDREILERRSGGETLDAVGRDLRVTRERVRQIQLKATRRLVDGVAYFYPSLDDRLDEVAKLPAASESSLQELLHLPRSVALAVLLTAKGFQQPHAWTHPLDHWWSKEPMRLEEALNRVLDLAPFGILAADEIAAALALPDDYESVFGADDSRLSRHQLGWVRQSRRARDIAYLWLLSCGDPQPAAAIAEVAGVNEHAIRETMRRDETFVQLRPEGTWALADWSLPSASTRYGSALDVMVEVLTELGPLNFPRLRDEIQRRYPVTDWRVQQCLRSNQIGVNQDGLYDLVERGAERIEETEPRKPDHIRVAGNVIGVELKVGHDLLRGSGLAVHHWLTWYLGLRSAPSSRHFRLPRAFGAVVVRRATSNAQISSLRLPALALGVALGCQVALLLHTDHDTADLVHTCAPQACPASGPTVARLSDCV